MLGEHAADHREEPFFLYLAFTAPHFPLHALAEDIALYQNRYRAGWDVLRQERYDRMKKMGLVNCPFSKLVESDVVAHWNNPEAGLRRQIGAGEGAHILPLNEFDQKAKKFQAAKM